VARVPETSPAVSRAWPDAETMLTPTSEELAENKDYTILVVDDDLVNVQVLTNYLSLQNYGVVQAFDGFEALEALEEVEADLILLDIMMPRMSGYEVCQKVRARYPANELPIVLLTAKDQIRDLVGGFEAGANDYLTKPFDKNELLARTKTHLRLAKINAAYGRFVPHEFLRFLEKESIVDVRLGDQVRGEMTILFSDIRSFTSLSESMTPQENFNFLNAYLGRVSPVIRQYNGFIDKYIGDTVMALFPDKAEDALQAAIAMRRELLYYNAYRQERGHKPIGIGVGIHTGYLMLGTIGESKRMEGTVISDAVNLTSRLEGLNKLYGASIIISQDSLFSLSQPTNYQFRFLDRVQVKGKQEPVSIFEIFDGDPEEIKALKLKTSTDFEKGLLYYHNQEFTAARSHFEQVLSQNPADQAAQLYLKRISYFIEYGVPPDWEGIEALTEK
jgi:two-component system sensor histidine kinase ChiS